MKRGMRARTSSLGLEADPYDNASVCDSCRCRTAVQDARANQYLSSTRIAEVKPASLLFRPSALDLDGLTPSGNSWVSTGRDLVRYAPLYSPHLPPHRAFFSDAHRKQRSQEIQGPATLSALFPIPPASLQHLSEAHLELLFKHHVKQCPAQHRRDG